MTYTINVDGYFNIEKTMECGQCFHYEKLDDNEYRVYGSKSICEVRQENDKVFISSSDSVFWDSYFALDMNYSEIYRYLYDFAIKNKDDFIIKSLECGKGIHILRQPFFETCCSYILSQQNNIPRIRKMIFDLSNKFSTNIVNHSSDILRCFPKPVDLRTVTIDELKGLGLGYRAEYLKLFVEDWENIFDRVRFNYEHDFELFKSCKGIGDKVSNCICLYGFGEYDAFPIDTWMKRIIKEEYTDKGKKLLIPNKYAGILQQYMFYTKRLENDK